MMSVNPLKILKHTIRSVFKRLNSVVCVCIAAVSRQPLGAAAGDGQTASVGVDPRQLTAGSRRRPARRVATRRHAGEDGLDPCATQHWTVVPCERGGNRGSATSH